HPLRPQPPGRRPQDGGDDERQEDGEDPDPQLREEPPDDDRPGGHEDQAPRPPGERGQPPSDDDAAVHGLGVVLDGGLAAHVSPQTRVGLTSTMRASSPLMNVGDSSVLSSVARTTASLTATSSGTSSLKRISQAPRRRMARSTSGMRSSVHPWL